ncbi:hypothetical protein Tco_1473636 [Tanacetum coccineum]
MDWLSKRKFVIVCYEKVVRIPLEGDEILRVHGERTLGATKALMNARVDEPRISDIPMARDITDVFQKTCWGYHRDDKLSSAQIWFMERRQSRMGYALSRNERVKSRRVRGMIQAAQSEAFKQGKVLLVGSVVDEAHASRYLVHPGTDKTYYNLGDMYCSLIPLSRGSFDVIVGMDWLSKRKFVIVCHEKVVRIPLEGDEILQVHGECTQGVVKTLMNTKFHIDLVHGATSVAKSPYRLAPLEMQELSEQLRELQDKVVDALSRKELEDGVNTKTESPVLWTEIGESSLIGPELVQEMTDKVVLIKEKPQSGERRQKSYADNRRKPLEFEVGDRVMLKVSPWKGVIRFGKKGKLALRYVGPFEILKRIGPIAYRLRLPKEFSGIIDREVKSLKRSRISLVKVRWNSKRGPEFTWEHRTGLYDSLKYLSLLLIELMNRLVHISGDEYFLRRGIIVDNRDLSSDFPFACLETSSGVVFGILEASSGSAVKFEDTKKP